jgi:hypothetical protein
VEIPLFHQPSFDLVVANMGVWVAGGNNDTSGLWMASHNFGFGFQQAFYFWVEQV